MDKFEQYLILEVTESAANTFTQEEVYCPVALPTSAAAKGRILELTSIVCEFDHPELIANSTTYNTVQITSTSQTGLVDITDPDVYWKSKREVQNLQSAAGESALEREVLVEHNLQDEKGNGILYPFDSIFVGIKGANNTSAKTFKGRLYYRFVDVGAAEILQMINP